MFQLKVFNALLNIYICTYFDSAVNIIALVADQQLGSENTFRAIYCKKGGLNGFEKKIDRGQPERIAQAERGRYFLPNLFYLMI